MTGINPQDDATALALEGERIAKVDPLCNLIRDEEPELSRRGFDIGLAIDPTGTLQGPRKEDFKKTLPAGEQAAYQRGVDFHIDRNATRPLSFLGAAVLAANVEALAARETLPVGNSWLGFNIAAGHFGSKSDGGLGNTAQGPGSREVKSHLSAAAKIGYDAALTFFKIPQ
jgi:hypothetical protein